MDISPLVWVATAGAIAALLALDLLVFHRNAHEVSTREAALTSAGWIAMGLGFAGVIWAAWGGLAAGQYLTGYLLEKTLSVDNIFVIALIVATFAVPPRLQHRLLFWGVVGALVMRAGFVAAGAVLLEHFHWTIFVFGAVLLASGVRMAFHDDSERDVRNNPALRLLRRFVPVADDHTDGRFLVRRAGRLMATPLLAALVVVEGTDLVFAVDSIPAVYAVTEEPFLVFTSNAFAVLGMRALFFLLAGMMVRFSYLKPALAVVLVFVGAKLLISPLFHVPTLLSLGVIGSVIGTGVVASLVAERRVALAIDPRVAEEVSR